MNNDAIPGKSNELLIHRKSGNNPGNSKRQNKAINKQGLDQSVEKTRKENSLPCDSIKRANLSSEQNTINYMGNDDTDCDEDGIAPIDGDGVTLRVDADEDEFTDSDLDESVKIKTPLQDQDPEEIPTEVIERLKDHPMMQQFVDQMVTRQLREYEENTSKNRERDKVPRNHSSIRRG